MNIYKVYNTLTQDEKELVDLAFDEVKQSFISYYAPQNFADPAEHLIEAIAVYLKAGQERAGVERYV